MTPRYRCTGQPYREGEDPRDRWHPDFHSTDDGDVCDFCGWLFDDDYEEVDP